MLFLLLSMLNAAHAEELALSVTLPGVAQQDLVFPAPTQGPLPSVWLSGADGRAWVVSVAVAPREVGQYRFDIQVDALEADRRGRLRREVVSQPRITTMTGVPATITQGSRRPITDEHGEVHFVDEDVLHIELVLRD